MVEHHSSYLLWARRLRCGAIAGLTSISLIAGESMDVRADWPLSKRKKPVESAEAKQANDFNNAVRKLMAEAKSHADKGELDRAIYLAERAAKISESSANLVRCAPDVSPAATANFVSELRTQRTDLLKPRSGSAVGPESIATNRSGDSVAPSSTVGPQSHQNKNSTDANRAVRSGNPGGSIPAGKSQQKSQTVASKAVQFPSENVLPPLSTIATSPIAIRAVEGGAADQIHEPMPELSDVALHVVVDSSNSPSSGTDEPEFAATTKKTPVMSGPSNSAITAESEDLGFPVNNVAQQKSVDASESSVVDTLDPETPEMMIPKVAETAVENVTEFEESDPQQLSTLDISQAKDELEELTELPAVSTPMVKLRVRRRDVESSLRSELESPSLQPDVEQVTPPHDGLADLESPIQDGGQPVESLDVTLVPSAEENSETRPLESVVPSGKLRLRPQRRLSNESHTADLATESTPSSDVTQLPVVAENRTLNDDPTTEVPVVWTDPDVSIPFVDMELTEPVETSLAEGPPTEIPQVVNDESPPSVTSAGPIQLKLRSRFPVRSAQSADEAQADDVQKVTPAKGEALPQVDSAKTATTEFNPKATLPRQIDHRLTPSPETRSSEVDQVTEKPQSDDAPSGIKLRARYQERKPVQVDLPKTQNTIKLRKTYDRLSSATPASTETNFEERSPSRQSQNSGDQPTATDEPLTDEVVSEPKSAAQELPETSASNQSANTTKRPLFRLRKQSVALDNATASASSGHSANGETPGSGSSVAPLPPKADTRGSASRKRSVPPKASTRGLQSERDPISMSDTPAVSSPDEDVPMASVNPSGKTAAKRTLASFEDDQALLSRAILENGPIQRFAQLFSLPHATAASTLGVLGIVMLMGGLWLVRATLRINPS